METPNIGKALNVPYELTGTRQHIIMVVPPVLQERYTHKNDQSESQSTNVSDNVPHTFMTVQSLVERYRIIHLFG